METENTNWIKEYFKKENHNFNSLFEVDINSQELQQKKKEIKVQQEILNNMILECQKISDNLLKEGIIPFKIKIIGKYTSKNYDVFYYDLFTSSLLDKNVVKNMVNDNTCDITDLYCKNGKVQLVLGYNLELGCVVLGRYSYSISTNNLDISMKLDEKIIIPFFQEIEYGYNVLTGEQYETKVHDISFNCIEFIEQMFGVKYTGSLSFLQLKRCYLDNKSFEIILKTAPASIIDYLLSLKIDKPIPIYKILGISKEEYNYAEERNVLNDFIKFNRLILLDNSRTIMAWLDFIEKVNHYYEDLLFYNIVKYEYPWREKTLFEIIIENYQEFFSEFYSLTDFTDYTINETINQGYTSYSTFIEELKDYLIMCKAQNIKPTLYSSYLKQTHDITARNHKISLLEQDEEIFQEKYEDFKEYNDNTYCVIAPKSSKDLIIEGDRLNHCVASYIKRVIDGYCLIYFLRKKDNKEDSLITFEVRNNAIVQVKGSHNRKPTRQEQLALLGFANKYDIFYEI